MTNPQSGADAASAAIPVICDKCRAEGAAGEPGFAQIADILDFEPVPRRAQVNNWSAEHQRAFIAALAITGSAARAARSLGRHARGAEKLRVARGGRAFAEAWDAALEIAREREFARLRDNLVQLRGEDEAANARGEPAARGSGARNDWDEDEEFDPEQDYRDAQERIRERLLNARRLFLALICGDAELRAAWETLVGPVDWDKAQRQQPQDNEPFHVQMRKPDMLLPVEWGLLPDLTGGPSLMAELREELRQEGIGKPEGD